MTYPIKFYPNYFWKYRCPIWVFRIDLKNYPIPSVFVWVAWHYPPKTPVIIKLFLITVARFAIFQIHWVMFSWQMVLGDPEAQWVSRSFPAFSGRWVPESHFRGKMKLICWATMTKGVRHSPGLLPRRHHLEPQKSASSLLSYNSGGMAYAGIIGKPFHPEACVVQLRKNIRHSYPRKPNRNRYRFFLSLFHWKHPKIWRVFLIYGPAHRSAIFWFGLPGWVSKHLRATQLSTSLS